MSTFVKKVTSTVAALAIVFSIVSPIAGVSAAFTSLESANKLSTLGVIVDKSANPADYRLGDNLPRKEGVKVMMNLASETVGDNCAGKFSDLKATDWACKYAETALANGMVAANATFGPDRLLSKIEALKMVFQGRDLEKMDNADWRAGYVAAAVEMGVADAAFMDYDAAVTRGQFFIWAANAIDAEDVAVEDDLLCAILGTCEDDGDETTDPTDPVVVGDGELEVSLSPLTPAASTIPGRANGITAAKFDFTAGDSDVTVTQVSVKRTGLSDKDTLENLAIFSSEGRVSNAKSDNQENDTTAQINLDNGGVVVPAGKTVTLSVVVDVAPVALSANDEFALEIVDVIANGKVTMDGSVVSKSMRVGSVNAPQITFSNGGTVSNPNLGEQAADIFEFEIDGDSEEDVILKSITFEGSSDAEDDLMNFELVMGTKVVATTKAMNGDYLTFNLAGGLTIEEDKNEDFTVRADVVDGAGDSLTFDIDAALDVTANSTKFGFGAAVSITAFNPGAIVLQAGELTFVEVDSEIDEIREDKDNVVLGSVKVTNVSGQALEMQKFGVIIALDDGGTATLPLNAPGSLTVIQALEDVELYNVETGSSYELTAGTVTTAGNVTTATFSDTNIDVLIEEGTTTWAIRADTAQDINNFQNVKFDISVNVATDVKVVELADDKEVTDKTPSSLSFNTIDGSESGAQVNLFPLSATNVVRGAQDVVALQFEVEAEEVSALTVDEMTVTVLGAGAVAATKQQIAKVSLYKGSVSAGNLLDSESDISNAGQVTFDKMGDVMIAANGTQTFVVTVSLVDSNDAVTGSNYIARLSAISIEDDENDDIVVGTLPAISTRAITVNQAGTLAIPTADAANEDNEFDKLALAGKSTVIASYDVRANNEEVDVETVVFNVAGAVGTLKNSVVNASILLNGKVIVTNANADITNTTITFDDITGLIIPETTGELALQLNTASIGKDLVGASQAALTITSMVMSDAEGVESGKSTASVTSTGTSKTLDIVSAVVTPAVVGSFGTDDQNAEVRLVVDGGANTTVIGDSVQAELTTLTLEATSVTLAGAVTVFNGNGTTIGTAVVAAGNSTVVVTVTSDSIGSNNEVYRIETTAKGSFRLAKNGVTYTVNGAGATTTKLENTLSIGQYNTSN